MPAVALAYLSLAKKGEIRSVQEIRTKDEFGLAGYAFFVGVAALATVSAPTAMGVRMAELTGLRLWGMCRSPQAVLYASGSGQPPVPGNASALPGPGATS